MSQQLQRAWLVAAAMVAVYAAGPRIFGQGFKLAAFGDALQCLAGIVLVVAAWSNVHRGSPEMRKFWVLMTISFALWGMGQFVWTYYEVYKRTDMPQVSPWDGLYFLKGVPLLAALGLQPHREPVKDRPNIGLLDLAIIVLWFVYLYFFFVTPWQYIHLDAGEYGVCSECGEEIAPARLRVMPEVLTCVRCQDRLERASRHMPVEVEVGAEDE